MAKSNCAEFHPIESNRNVNPKDRDSIDASKGERWINVGVAVAGIGFLTDSSKQKLLHDLK